MRRAMAEAAVGDDEYGEDPAVRALEEAFAERVGKPAALFVASGTMANQVALRVLTSPGDVVVAGRRQHVVAHEYGASALNAGVQFAALDDSDGMLAADAVRRARQAADHHHPAVGLVSIENTHMAAAVPCGPSTGCTTSLAAAGPVPVHLDGARLFNAEVGHRHRRGGRWAAGMTTVTCCLSKGLCAPAGSLLAGDVDVIEAARLARKRLGGGLHQAGVLAAPGLVALRDMTGTTEPKTMPAPARLAEAVAIALARVRSGPGHCAHEHRDLPPPRAGEVAGPSRGPRRARPAPSTPDAVRFVTHHDVDDAGIERGHGRAGRRPGREAGDEGADRHQRRRRRASGPRPWWRLAQAVTETGFDSLWLPEVLTRPGPDPLVGLAWLSGACPRLKIGTTMLLPGRNLVWLAKAVGTLDLLSGGRFLLTFVPGLAVGRRAQRHRGARRTRRADPDGRRTCLCCAGSGRARASATMARPAPSPTSRSRRAGPGSLRRLARRQRARPRSERCGRLADGWIPAFCTPAKPRRARQVIDRVAAEHGRAISPEHFGVSLAYAPTAPTWRRWRRPPWPAGPAATRSRNSSRSDSTASVAMLEQFGAVGFSKFVVRPAGAPEVARRTRVPGRRRRRPPVLSTGAVACPLGLPRRDGHDRPLRCCACPNHP